MSVLAAGPSPFWYLTRGAGAVALLLLTASVVLGILDFSRWRTDAWPRFLTDALHRNVSMLALVLVAIHVITTVADGFAPIGLQDSLIPFLSPYRPLWLGLGAISFDLLLAVAVTSALRRHVGYRAWRIVHWGSYGCWPLALVHGLGTGSDTASAWMLLLSVGCLAAVLLAFGWRVAATAPGSAGRRLATGALTIGPIALIVWVALGPLAGNWAARAGTPPNLLPSAPPASVGTGAQAARGLQVPFEARLTGSLRQRTLASGLATVQLRMSMSGGASGSLDVTLSGQPLAGGGVAMSQSSVSLGPPANPRLYSGDVTALRGARILASASGGGTSMRLTIDLTIDQESGAISGTVHAQGEPNG
jgi:Ferric reductase like transmembrane component